MEINILNQNLKQRASIIRALLILVAGLTITTVLCTSLLYKTVSHKDIVLIPAGFSQTAEITNNNVSASYLDQITVMMVNQRLNVKPDNIDQSNAAILLYVNPEYYASFKQQLDLDAATIKDQKISSAFYITDVKSDPEDLMAEVSGTLNRWVGDRLIGSSAKTYDLKFSKEGYQLMLDGFSEITKK